MFMPETMPYCFALATTPKRVVTAEEWEHIWKEIHTPKRPELFDSARHCLPQVANSKKIDIADAFKVALKVICGWQGMKCKTKWTDIKPYNPQH